MRNMGRRPAPAYTRKGQARRPWQSGGAQTELDKAQKEFHIAYGRQIENYLKHALA